MTFIYVFKIAVYKHDKSWFNVVPHFNPFKPEFTIVIFIHK